LAVKTLANGPCCRFGKKKKLWRMDRVGGENFIFLATKMPACSAIDKMEEWHDQNVCSKTKNHCES